MLQLSSYAAVYLYLKPTSVCCVVREKLFKQSLAQLKEEMMKANVLVREANFLAQEMAKDAEFSVTLQIPAANLSPNRKVGAEEDVRLV